MNQYNLLNFGSSFGWFQGDPKGLVEDVELLQPTVFPGVPRVWQKLYDKVLSGVEQGSWISRVMFQQAYASKASAIENGTPPSSIWESLVFSKVKARFGGKVQMTVSGSAPISPAVADFVKICVAEHFAEGYGLTESCSGGTTTSLIDRKFGNSVGTP